MSMKTILVIGTYDTKNDELSYLCDRIARQGAKVVAMDVSVLGDPATPVDISKHEVAAATGKTFKTRSMRATKITPCRLWPLGLRRFALSCTDKVTLMR